MVIAVDFDGTITKESTFPFIGELRLEFIEWLKNRQKNGDKLILWTCRHSEYLDDAVKACSKHGLIFDAINENLTEKSDPYYKQVRKIIADIYIDDMAINIKDVLNQI